MMSILDKEPVRAFRIEIETSIHVSSRERLLDRAMGPGRKWKSSEKLRQGARPAEGLSFVALNQRGFVSGTIRLWNILLGDTAAPALLLGPLAVDPDYWNAGIGSMLMRHALAEAKRLEHSAIVLVGDASFYVRFGFTAKETGMLRMPGSYEASRLLALELKDGALKDVCGMIRAAGPGDFVSGLVDAANH